MAGVHTVISYSINTMGQHYLTVLKVVNRAFQQKKLANMDRVDLVAVVVVAEQEVIF